MSRWSRKGVLVRRGVEAVLVLAALAWSTAYLIWGGSELGIWDTIARLVVVGFCIVLLAYFELSLDPRLERRERDYVHPVILGLFKASLALLGIWVVSDVIVHFAAVNVPDATILFDIVVFLLDVTGLATVVSLFLARLRLNRDERISNHNP